MENEQVLELVKKCLNGKADLEELLTIKEWIESTIAENANNIVEQNLAQIKKVATAMGVPVDSLINKRSRSSSKTIKVAGTTFVNPENPNETWGGKGKRPQWLVKQLEAGKDLADFEKK
ncbi:MAG: H-NS family nucleoid-associated regulatory protein [Sedimentibacter sp.]